VANSVKALVCLKEKKLEFASHYVNLLRFEQHAPEYLAVNPDGIVPTLVHDGVRITESSVINEYLDEVFPDPPLKPASAIERARMRIWTKYVDDYFGPAASRIGWHFLLHPIASRLSAEEREQRLARIPLRDRREKWATVASRSFTPEQLAEARDQIAEGVRRMEALLEKSPWMAGQSYSLADIATYCVAPGLPRLAPELMNETLTPRCVQWLRAMNERPAVQAALAMPNKVPETLRALGIAGPAMKPGSPEIK
jgi:glutathione S-transferase